MKREVAKNKKIIDLLFMSMSAFKIQFRFLSKKYNGKYLITCKQEMIVGGILL